MLNTTFPSWVVAKRGSKVRELLTKHSKQLVGKQIVVSWALKKNTSIFSYQLVT